MRKITVEDIMCDHPIVIQESVDVGSATHLLLRYRINGLLVVRKDTKDDLIGIFTSTDALKILNDIYSQKERDINTFIKAARQPVGEIASKNIISVQKSEDIDKAISIMVTKNVHTIPVFDKDKLVGVLGRHDIINIAFYTGIQ